MVHTTLSVCTRGPGLIEITDDIVGWVGKQAVENGLFTLFVWHTSSSLTIQENADPDVQADLLAFFQRIVPEGAGYIHDAEGPDDMPAHIKSALTQTSLSIPLIDGRLTLGTWQGIYLFEHRAHPHHRQVIVHLIGTSETRP
ncbi:MAG: secondary thiamine-phosphate synthase enzyme YjbQ [Pseudomonadota bacterium]